MPGVPVKIRTVKASKLLNASKKSEIFQEELACCRLINWAGSKIPRFLFYAVSLLKAARLRLLNLWPMIILRGRCIYTILMSRKIIHALVNASMIARFKGATVVRLQLHLYIKYLSPTTPHHMSHKLSHKLITTVAIYLASQDQITDPNVTLKIDKLLLRYGEREVRAIGVSERISLPF